MDTIKVIHDTVGHTLTIWFGDPETEHICEETTDEVVLMKNSSGRVIGFEVLHFHTEPGSAKLSVEAITTP
jgi:hypothetical protein